MAHIIEDMTRETGTVTGAGNPYSLSGEVTGYANFDASMATNDTCWYRASSGANYEVGLGTFTSGAPDTLARTAIYESSNGGAAVVWGASTVVDVLMCVPARFVELLNTMEITVADSATPDIGAVQGSRVVCDGTTTITSFGTATYKLRVVRFSGIRTLTHNATSLIMLGGASRTTAAGDIGIYASDGSGNWREINWQRAVAATAFSDIKQAASTTATGVVELATDAEAQAIADTGRVITPSNLAAMVATQANQETGTANDRFVTPGSQHFHPSAPKAWGKCTQTGTMTLNAGYGVSSITDSGVGTTTWNLSVTFSSTHYATVLGLNNVAGAYDHTVSGSWTATTFIQYHLNNANTPQDGIIFMAAFGDL